VLEEVTDLNQEPYRWLQILHLKSTVYDVSFVDPGLQVVTLLILPENIWN